MPWDEGNGPRLPATAAELIDELIGGVRGCRKAQEQLERGEITREKCADLMAWHLSMALAGGDNVGWPEIESNLERLNALEGEPSNPAP